MSRHVTKTPAPTCKTLHTRCSGETPADYEYCEPSDWSAGMFAFSFCCRTPAYKAADRGRCREAVTSPTRTQKEIGS